MKAKILVAALTAAGIISGLPQALADTITPPATVAPQPNPTTTPAQYSVTYPVNVTIGTTPTNFNAVFNGATGQWTTSNAAWTYAGPLNQQANTAVFTTTQGGVSYAVAISGAGTTGGFTPTLGTPTTVPPSVGVNLTAVPVTSPALPGFGSATATGTVTGIGITTATLVPQNATVQPVGTNPGGQPISVTLGGTNTISPTSATSGPGSASGSVAVNSNQTNSSVTFGNYTINFPTTPTPAGTTSVAGTISGAGGSLGSGGLNIGGISGTATYNPNTGVITATPAFTSGFSVNGSGNVAIGCDTNTAATAGLVVCSGINRGGQPLVIGSTGAPGPITLNGQVTNNGPTTMNGTLAVTGATTTAGIANTGALTTTTLGVSGNATIGGTLTTAGLTNTGTFTNTGTINNTGNITGNGNISVGGNVTVTGTTTLSGATSIGGSAVGGNAIAVSSTGVALASGSNANIVLNASGAQVSGGGTTMQLTSTGVRFTGPAPTGQTGGPVTVTGVANGSGQYDAVNFGQFDDARKRAARGISAVSAITNIPQVTEGKQFNIGVGVGGYDSETGFAVGGSLRVGSAGIIKASVGTGSGSGSKTAWGLGGGWSW